jgi:hypothetical protein
MSREMSVETFHRYFYFPTFLPENKNIYENAHGNFPQTFVARNGGK